MTDIRYKITFLTYWHCGSGLAAGADVDLLPVKDRNGLPFVPGKTIKGLVREAAETITKFRGGDAEKLSECFGMFDNAERKEQGEAFFSNATLSASDSRYVVGRQCQDFLYKSIASTAIGTDGIAKNHSLRKIDVAVPCQLEGEVRNVPDGCTDIVKESLMYVKRIGMNRTRGLGRCKIEIVGEQTAKAEEKGNCEVTDRLQFRCTLTTDVVLNVKSATEGNNQTLDFIPGNNFLGIAAGQLYAKVDPMTAWTLFHSGKVRFGDAHPLDGAMRSVRVPAAMYQPKLDKTESYISFLTDMKSADIRKKQLKQCRNGFYAFADGKGTPTATDKQFAIKSAYDRKERRSKDEAMYGYESLAAGQTFAFEVEVDADCDNSLKLQIAEALCGSRRLGRSRTAQYGLVQIECAGFSETPSQAATGDEVTVYADGRLIFLDHDDNMPTFQPTAADLGLPADAEIDWGKSQVRTFQYAPWNFKRQAYDADRCGIEKGSVFVARCKSGCPAESRYVGAYRNEGFGKVVYNPDFLKAETGGKAKYQLKAAEKAAAAVNADVEPQGALQTYLLKQVDLYPKMLKIYEAVNQFVEKNWDRFKDDSFASQWGTIRQNPSREFLLDGANAYLTHGVAMDKWNSRGRLNAFKDFINDNKHLDERLLLINLASEMAKRYRTKKN